MDGSTRKSCIRIRPCKWSVHVDILYSHSRINGLATSYLSFTIVHSNYRVLNSMLTLYSFGSSANTLKPLLTLYEKGLDFEARYLKHDAPA